MTERINEIKQLLNETEAALICTKVNRRYLTDFPSSLGYLLCTKNEAYLFLDGRYYLAASLKVCGVKLILLESLGKQLETLVKKCNISTIFVEQEISVGQLNGFKNILPQTEIIADDKLSKKLLQLRCIKNEKEIENILTAQKIAEKAFLETLNFVKAGVSEKRIATELEYRMSLLGSQEPSFETIVISGNKTAMPHGVPTEKLIENGDFVTFDFGAVTEGYHSDMTRTVAVSFLTEEMEKVYNTVLNANVLVENSLKPGMLCKDADSLARDVIEKAGYGKYFTHSLGHAVGLEIHEAPSLSPKSEEVLKVGNIVTDEPGIYLDGKFGVRIEEMLLITENGAKNLTHCDKKLIIV